MLGILKMVFRVFKALISFFKYTIYVILGIIAIFYVLVTVHLIINRFKGKTLKKGSHVRIKKPGFFRKLFIDLPKRYTEDLLAKDPDFFPYQGLIIYEGRQRKWKNINNDS